jgi:hypothetical protein
VVVVVTAKEVVVTAAEGVAAGTEVVVAAKDAEDTRRATTTPRSVPAQTTRTGNVNFFANHNTLLRASPTDPSLL